MTAPPPEAPLAIDLDRPTRVGILLLVGGFLGFLLWASLAPLKSAAVAPGIVVADTRNKTIQHLEGGIISEVLVREGDVVRQGQVLARIDGVVANANLGRIQAAYLAALAEEARLIAERDEREEIRFPDALTQSPDPEAVDAMEGQVALFKARRLAQASERDILGQRIAQFSEEIKGLEAQVVAQERQIALIEQELADVRGLVQKGLERRSRLLALERAAAGIEGERGEHTAMIARARQNIAEMEQRLVNIRAQHLNETVEGLREIHMRLADSRQQMVAARDASRRLDVLAPLSGKVVSVYRQTPGGVVKPGETIMEVLPDEDLLVVEAQVRPEDIDVVAPDQIVRVRLTAYNFRSTPTLKGRVSEVSADRIIDQRGERAHFLARVVVDASELESQPGMRLYPGMPATAFIETGRVTLLDYLLTPVFGGLERGLREQ